MDMRTGEIAPLKELLARGVPKKYLRKVRTDSDSRGNMKEIRLSNLSPRVRRMVETTYHGKISRNSACPCGSGTRFKRCCMMVE
jgi:hypothetical protein